MLRRFSKCTCESDRPVSVSQRKHWNGPPEQIRELFTLTRVTGVRAVCLLWTHPLGWEMRLLVNDTFTRSQVVRDPADIQRIANEWRDAMIRDGWRTR